MNILLPFHLNFEHFPIILMPGFTIQLAAHLTADQGPVVQN